MSKQKKIKSPKDVVLVLNGKVAQKWTSGKPMEKLRKHLGEDADLREVDAGTCDCEMIANEDGTYTAPEPVIDQEQVKYEKRIKKLFKESKSNDPAMQALRKLVKLAFRELAEEED